MTMHPPTILVAGAGIGGLTTLLSLHAHDIPATAIDRAATLDPIGVGLNLLPHAVRELHHLGLGERLDQISLTPHRLDFFDPRGTLLWREPLGVAGGYGYPQCSVHRGALQMLLLDAVTERLGPGAVRTDTTVTGFDDTGDHLIAHTSSGDQPCALLVGADGIHSAIRAALHPRVNDPILFSGVRMYRGATRHEPYLDGTSMAIVKADHGVELVLYPLAGGLINWVLLVPEHPRSGGDDLGWDRPVDRDTLITHVADWDLGWLDPVALIEATSSPAQFPMVDREPLSWWGRGPVTLLGDAAHPMYPVGANGGSQTIVDAAVLAESLTSNASAGGLRDYERARIPATAEVVLANRERHRSDPNRQAEAAARYRSSTGADTIRTTH